MIVDVQIPADVADDIRNRLLDGKGSPRNEHCGILYGKRVEKMAGDQIKEVTFIIDGWQEIPNRSGDADDNFKIVGKDIAKALAKSGRTQAEVLGPVHTHPAGSTPDPSRNDLMDLPDECVGIVLHATTGRLTYYNADLGFIKKDEK